MQFTGFNAVETLAECEITNQIESCIVVPLSKIDSIIRGEGRKFDESRDELPRIVLDEGFLSREGFVGKRM